MIFVCLCAFILNFRNFFKYRGQRSSLFLILNRVFCISIFNIIFYYFRILFGISFSDFNLFIFIWIISLVMYFLKFRFMCITYSGFIYYILGLVFGYHIEFKITIFLIGILHLFEGMYVILNDINLFLYDDYKFGNLDLYLPIFLDGFVFIFLIFYRRKEFYLRNFTCFKNFSGGIIFLYGLIILITCILNLNFIFCSLQFIFIVIFHEIITKLDGFFYKNILNLKDWF